MGIGEPGHIVEKANEKPSVDGQRILLFLGKSTKCQIINLTGILFEHMAPFVVESSCSSESISNASNKNSLEGLLLMSRISQKSPATPNGTVDTDVHCRGRAQIHAFS